MKKSSLFILLTVSVLQSVFAQDADTSSKKSAPVVITGSIDGYYRYNFNNPKDPPYNNLTSFTRSHNSFELGMASIRADHSFGKVSATIDLGFGARAESFSYNDAGTRFAIKQAYISYAPWQAVKFTFGTWATHIGYEMADAYLNRNYSMSYMFTNGPFTHTGLKADISLGGKTAMMIGISNPTDFRTAPGMPKSVIAQFSTGTKDDKFKAYLNLVAGKQSDFKKLVQPDLVALYAISPEFSIGFNGTLQEVKLDADSTGRFSNYQWCLHLLLFLLMAALVGILQLFLPAAAALRGLAVQRRRRGDIEFLTGLARGRRVRVMHDALLVDPLVEALRTGGERQEQPGEQQPGLHALR